MYSYTVECTFTNPTISNAPSTHFPSTVSGIVAELSPEAAEKSGLSKGDGVFALIGGGGYAGGYN